MEDDLNSSFGFVLHDIARLLRKNFDKRARTLDLTRSQWSVIAHLMRHDGIQQKMLAEILEITPTTLVGLVDRMEKSRWLERRDDPSDRRAKLLFLTPKAKIVFEKLKKMGKETREEAFKGIRADEREAFMKTLLKIRDTLSDKKQP